MNLFIHRVCEMFDQATFKACLTGIVAFFSWLLGGFDLPFKALMLLFVIDYLLGFSLAIRNHCVNGAKMWGGICKFLLYAVAVMVAHLLDLSSGDLLPWFDNPVRDFMIGYLAANEFLSVSVHLDAFGVRLPMGLVSRVKHYRDRAERSECKEGAR